MKPRRQLLFCPTIVLCPSPNSGVERRKPLIIFGDKVFKEINKVK